MIWKMFANYVPKSTAHRHYQTRLFSLDDYFQRVFKRTLRASHNMAYSVSQKLLDYVWDLGF